MESEVCMNAQCGTSTSSEWRKGWPMRSGQFGCLCDKCGSAYEQLIFCDVFHTKESGWRKCNSCGKRLHCGCIASRFMIELLDSGGVNCTSCAKNSVLNHMGINDTANGLGFVKVDNIRELCSFAAEGHMGGGSVDKTSHKHLLQFQNIDTSQSFAQARQEEAPTKLDILRKHIEKKDNYESPAQPNLNISLGPSVKPSVFHDSVVDDRGKTASIFQQAPNSRQLLPKPPNGNMVSQMRIARPPAEVIRGKTQLLPRYRPRITEQELQQISGDSNSNVVPLFEKVLSASDAGRIGRLVLPKACAEAYFPTISQPEGLPLRIQDIKGKEWVFQFRFWPNNNSRMYVLEGVTPCIQSMQLQAGDTVTFSRKGPEQRLVMGFRKATNSPTAQSFKGSSDTRLDMFSSNLSSAGGDINCHKHEKHEDTTRENMLLHSVAVPDRKRTRNIGSKNKRLRIDSIDSLELRLTWEEAQDMMRPSPSAKLSILTIEDHDFEEYDEPPVFGKRSIFVLRTTGGQEQWAQCDICVKWRRLPSDTLLPPKWTCSDNIWDPCRSLCSAPDELSPREQETLLRLNKDFKRRRIATSDIPNQEQRPSALDTLANVAMTRSNNTSEQVVVTPVAATTRHPRHRPGCSCIVCIQPPSGKGKHKPTCTCTVCQTVKRRFNTLMMRKRKNQSEREAEIAQASQQRFSVSREEIESVPTQSENEDQRASSVPESAKLSEIGAGHILDLNCHPDRREEPGLGFSRVSMMSLLQAASLPKQNGPANLGSEQQAASMHQVQPQVTTGESEEQGQINENSFTSATEDQVNGIEESREPEPMNQIQQDPR